jgi:hypothetical protein
MRIHAKESNPPVVAFEGRWLPPYAQGTGSIRSTVPSGSGPFGTSSVHR